MLPAPGFAATTSRKTRIGTLPASFAFADAGSGVAGAGFVSTGGVVVVDLSSLDEQPDKAIRAVNAAATLTLRVRLIVEFDLCTDNCIVSLPPRIDRRSRRVRWLDFP